MSAGELDELIAVRVMGLNLTPPRGFALAVVGCHETSVTGNPWTMRNGLSLVVPPGDELEQPEGTTDYNARYYAFVAEHGVEDLPAKIAACRIAPKPYSTDIAAAWEVIGQMIALGFSTVHVSHGTPNFDFYASFFKDKVSRGAYEYADTAPLAICKAALLAIATLPSTNSISTEPQVTESKEEQTGESR